MWSTLSELVAARIVIPFKMLITSSVFRVDFKKAFKELFFMVELKSLLIYSFRQVILSQSSSHFILIRGSLTLEIAMIMPKPQIGIL
jgi:hypothetical protein